jgi:hypothetical protein
MSELYRHDRPVFAEHVYDDYIARYEREKARYGRVLEPDVDKTAMTEVNIETFRTPAYMLSCAQDYRPGKPGYQQHPWQATLGLDAVVFTNHPGALGETGDLRPNFWAGDSVLPRAAQYRNLLACIHHVPPDHAFPYSHAYLPRSAFDEVIERGNWLLARTGNGFVALFSQNPTRRPSEGPHVDTEVRADAPDNIWLCELGTRQQWGTFGRFVEAISTSTLTCEGLQVYYKSPSQGWFGFGWHGPLWSEGAAMPLRGYQRFDNPYCQCDFADPHIAMQRGGEQYEIDMSDAAAYSE